MQGGKWEAVARDALTGTGGQASIGSTGTSANSSAVSRVDSSGVELRNPALILGRCPVSFWSSANHVFHSLARRGLRHVHEQMREREDIPDQASGLAGLRGIREFAEKQEDPYQTVPMLYLRHFDVSSFIIISFIVIRPWKSF